ncbi:site-specific DNA-methyltransferase [Campylobacter sp. CLAX-7218-21]|uniref:DNA-methyltransferase n=1 Tax=Campylobacter devanensis TaxID=3161138 RepID=UPI002EBAFD1C|nr:site-specific DNA-methyltransferase [Campylobacter sp. CLAX-7218-21]
MHYLTNKIYNGDVFEFLDILPDDIFDLAIVDPPYNLRVDEWDIFSSEDEFLSFSFLWIEKMLKKLKKTASFYIFNTPYNSALFLNFLKDKAIFQNFITWYKKDGMSTSKKRFNNNQESILFFTMGKNYYFDCESIRIPYLSTERMAHAAKKGILKNGKRWYPNPNGKLCPDVWEISSARHTNKINGKVVKQNHPTPKPKEMIERMIKASSKEHDLILDLFAGSCITSICAKELNRNFIACEKNKNFINSNLEIVI